MDAVQPDRTAVSGSPLASAWVTGENFLSSDQLPDDRFIYLEEGDIAETAATAQKCRDVQVDA